MTAKQIPYETYVSKLMKKYSNEGVTVNKTAKEEVSHVLNVIHAKIMDAFKTEIGPSKKLTSEEFVSCAIRSIQKAIPGNLKTFTLREAERQLTLYKNGVLQYNPEASLETLKKNAAREASSKRRTPKTKPAYDEFSAGISPILRNLNDRMTIENAAKQLIGYHLYELMWKITDSVTENIQEKTRMEPDDIREILPDFFPPEIVQYALGEGARKLNYYEAGIVTFRPKRNQPLSVVADAPQEQTPGRNKYDTGSEGHVPTLTFKSGIKKLLAKQEVQVQVDKLWLRDIAEILFDCAGSITERVKEVLLKESVGGIDFQEVDNVVQELFPENLYQHASYLGYKNAEKFFNGVLTYSKTLHSATPRTKKKSSRNVSQQILRAKSPRKEKIEKIPTKKTKISDEKASKSPKNQRKEKHTKTEMKRVKSPPARESDKRLPKKYKIDFTDNILKALQVVDDHLTVSVGREATDMLNRHVSSIYKALVSEAGKHDGHLLTSTQVRSAINSVLPPVLARYAIAHYSSSTFPEMHKSQKGEAMTEDDAGVAANEIEMEDGSTAIVGVAVDKSLSAEGYIDDQSSESENKSIPQTEDLSTTATESEPGNNVVESELDTTLELPEDEAL